MEKLLSCSFSSCSIAILQGNFTHTRYITVAPNKCDIYRLAKELTLITVFPLVSRDTKTLVATKIVNTSGAILTWVTHYTLVYI